MIDAADAMAVAQYNWRITRVGYAMRSTEPGRSEFLHRFIANRMGLSASLMVDHRNGDALDCRRQNLREASASQNQMNRRIGSNNKAGVKGVSWDPSRMKWRATLKMHRKYFALGRYDTVELAAAAVREARERLHGDFANHGPCIH